MISNASMKQIEYSQETSKLCELDHIILEMILQHPRLTLFDEVSLFNFICSIYQTNEYSKNWQSQNSKPTATLFEYVRFDHLTNESITKFISIFDIDDINSQIWSSICQRLIST